MALGCRHYSGYILMLQRRSAVEGVGKAKGATQVGWTQSWRTPYFVLPVVRLIEWKLKPAACGQFFALETGIQLTTTINQSTRSSQDQTYPVWTLTPKYPPSVPHVNMASQHRPWDGLREQETGNQVFQRCNNLPILLVHVISNPRNICWFMLNLKNYPNLNPFDLQYRITTLIYLNK